MSDSLDQYIDSVEHLPTPPLVIIRLIAAFRRPFADVGDVAKLVGQDPALASEVLHRCNTGIFAAEEPIADVFAAVMRMGYYEIYQTAVTMFSRRTMSIERPVGMIKADELWRHSGATAVLSQLLAHRADEDEGIAYTAGLLHDIGKMVLAFAEGSKYADLMKQAGTTGRALEDAEKAAFGFGHGAIGARLLEKWQVPIDIAIPVAHHHDTVWPEPGRRMSAIVSLGNILAHHLESIAGKKQFELPEAAAAIEALQIQGNALAALAQHAKHEIKTLANLLTAR